jgi:uncharacterized RDD family membrane protein YckC
MTEQPPQPPPPPPPPPPPGPPPPAAGQPVGQLPQQAYTSWITRVVAAIVDGIPAAIVLGIGYGVAFGTGENVCVEDTYGYGVYCTSSMSGTGVAILALAWLVSVAYWIWNYGYRQGTTGSSIGKSVMKFKVVSEATGQPIGFGLSIVRQIAHVVDAVICYIGFLFPLWDAKRQTLADKIMTTVCLPLNPQPLPPGPQ